MSGAIIFAAGSIIQSDVIDISVADHVQNFDLLWVGVTGNLKVQLVKDTDERIFLNVPVGFFPSAISKVVKTGTTASGMVGCNVVHKD